MRKFNQKAAMILFIGMGIASCNNNNDYPKDYVGFERTQQTHSYDAAKETEDVEIKIIAADKKDEDRVFKLEAGKQGIPGQQPVFKLMDSKITIKAGKKSASTTLTIYPKRLSKREFIRLVCTPQWKGENATATQLSIQFIKE